MSDEQKSVAVLAAEIKTDLAKSVDAVKEIAENALGKANAGEALTTGLKENADEALTKMNELGERLATLEQAADRPAGGDGQRKSLGEQFVEDDRVKSFVGSEASAGNVRFSTKATLTSLTTDAAGSVGDAINEARLPGIQMMPDRAMTIRNLLAPGSMDGNTLEYVQETGFTNNAAIVAEGDVKPESDIKFELKSTGARVIAHMMKASRQVLSDISQLRSIIDQRGRYGLAFTEEQQVLNGDGTGQNVNGIMSQATTYVAPAGVSASTNVDVLRAAMLQAALAEYPSTGMVLHPSDWTAIEMAKDGDGRYLIGNPQGTLSPTLWGLPVVTTQAMAQGSFLTGAFRLGAQLFDRWSVSVEMGYVNDDFARNLVSFRVEERIALAVYRPEAFITGTFS